MDLLVALFAVVLPVAVFAVGKAAERRRRRVKLRALAAVPETPIGAVKDGEKARIKGRVVAREPLRTSPISQRRCVGYRVIVECFDSAGPGWRRVVEDDALDAFALADDTGEAVLHARFEIGFAPYREAHALEASPALANLLVQKGVPVTEIVRTMGSFRYVETVLIPGREIIAVGRATVEIDSAGRSPSFRHPPTKCHLRGGEEPVVLLGADGLALS